MIKRGKKRLLREKMPEKIAETDRCRTWLLVKRFSHCYPDEKNLGDFGEEGGSQPAFWNDGLVAFKVKDAEVQLRFNKDIELAVVRK